MKLLNTYEPIQQNAATMEKKQVKMTFRVFFSLYCNFISKVYGLLRRRE